MRMVSFFSFQILFCSFALFREMRWEDHLLSASGHSLRPEWNKTELCKMFLL